MKNIFKYSYLALMATALVFTASCSDDDEERYEWGKAHRDQVYFSNTQATTISLAANVSSFDIPVYRAVTTNALTSPVKVTLPSGSKYHCNANAVEFAEGVNVAKLTFTFNPDEIEFDVFEEITVEVDETFYSNEYGITKLTFQVGMPAPWISLGKAWYRDDFVTTFFGVDNAEYQVELQKNITEPGLYRLVNPYGAAYPYNEPGDWDDSSDHYMVINANDPDKVYIERHYSSVDWGYGEMVMWGLAGYYLARGDEASAEQYYGKLENGVITFPEGSLLMAMMDYNDGGLYAANGSGMFRVVFPGIVLADYSAAIETAGRFIDTKENGQAVFNVTLGADVAYAKVAFDTGKDPNVAYEQIVYGDDAVVTLSASGEVRFPYAEPGDYVCIAVSYDADGNEQEYDYALINIPANGAPETYTAYFVGTYQHGVESLSQDGSIMWVDEDGNPYYNDEVILYGSDTDDSKCMLSPWVGVGLAENGTEGQGMVFYWNDDDSLVVPGSMTGIDSNYGEIWGWDLISANVANYPSYFDDETGEFVFCLAWSVEAGHFGFTVDTYTQTDYANAAPRSMKAKLSSNAKSAPKSLNTLHSKKQLRGSETTVSTKKQLPKFQGYAKEWAKYKK